ncbi:MAG: Mut7-C RNAse domain-containing protein [Acidobacteriota bacterium]
MHYVTFRFYAELNDFLPRKARQRDMLHEFHGRASVKDRIEALGVPHPEAELIRVNGCPVDFGYRVRDGDRISVYPHLASVPNPKPLRPPHPRGRFALDQHLAKLAAYLRLLGQDVVHRANWADDELARFAAEDSRVLLSRDRRLLMRRSVVHGGFVHATDPMQQVPEVLHRFGAPETFAPFTRCLACNGLLREAPKNEIAGRLAPDTRRFYERFWRCPGCDRVFWEGSHVRRMRTWVAAWLAHPDVPRLAAIP